MTTLRAIALACAAAVAAAVGAHESRPAYLSLKETSAGVFEVLFKTPRQGEMRLALTPRIGRAPEVLAPLRVRTPPGAAVQEWTVRAERLRGDVIAIEGLRSTLTDALIRVEFLDGSEFSARVTPDEPAALVPERQGAWQVLGVYLGIGVEHILLGIDHLLFVLALFLAAHGGWRLVATVTAFTVAHSITLALATLGVLRVPGPPVEAAIALSIVFVAAELVRGARGGAAGVMARAPWIVAFAFGLLHGLGFAGALAEVGLPEDRIPLALFAFNLGVEGGQLAFVTVLLVAALAWQRLTQVSPSPRLPGYAAPASITVLMAYGIGTTAAFWTIQRVTAF